MNRVNKSNLKNILFDLGNVLIDLDEKLWRRRMLEVLGKAPYAEFPVELEKMYLEFETGSKDRSHFVNEILRRSPHGSQALEVLDAWNSMLVGIKYQRIDTLRALRQKYKLYILSNTNAIHIEWIDKYLMKKLKFPAFYSLFNEIFLSHEIGERKPDPEAWKHVMEMSGIRASQTLFFDDRPENIETAAQLGFQVYLVPPSVEITDIIEDLKL